MKPFLERVNSRISHIPKTSKIALAISGGVDSAVSAYLLKELGYEVCCFFMQNWLDPNGDCHSEDDWNMVKIITKQLNLPVKLVNFAEEYWQSVFKQSLQDYAKHMTPNPDILCNREIKFSALQRFIVREGFDYLATGHYANVTQINGNYLLEQALDENKDQTYFLCALNQTQLSRSLFPLGSLYKREVRSIAQHIQLANSSRKESMGICFVEPNNFKAFLEQYIPKSPGDMVTTDGIVLGTHDGLPFYTIGQRQGLGIGGHKSLSGPWYVVDKNPSSNELIVTNQSELSKHKKNHFIVNPYHFIHEPPNRTQIVDCKLRHGPHKHKVTIKIKGNKLTVTLAEARYDLTPGQWSVFYNNRICLGGGQILKSVL